MIYSRICIRVGFEIILFSSLMFFVYSKFSIISMCYFLFRNVMEYDKKYGFYFAYGLNYYTDTPR